MNKAGKGVEKLDPKQFIIIKGASIHNLKTVDVAIPRNTFVVFTGVSGSGKSSLAIDTLYAEGQRRYVESLSSYARQFMKRMDKPDVEYIKGISPAIAIEQRTSNASSRSTVGTLTELYDYYRLLFGRLGKTISPISGEEVQKDQVTDVVNYILDQKEGAKLMVLSPLNFDKGRSITKELELLQQKGFVRLWADGEVLRIDETKPSQIKKVKQLCIVTDRLVVKKDDYDLSSRAADSVQIAFFEGEGSCTIAEIDGEARSFSSRFELDDIVFEEPSPQFFNFNNSYGACRNCEGFGTVIGIDENLVFPNRNLSIYDKAIAPWRGAKMKAWNDRLIKVSSDLKFPIHKPIRELTEAQYDLLWTGNSQFKGLDEFFKFLETQAYKIQYRVMMARYRGRTICKECKGTRLRGDTAHVKVAGYNIMQLLLLPIKELHVIFEKMEFPELEAVAAKRIVTEIRNRLQFLVDLGLGYLNLNRASNTLSGGEMQRINLTRSLGSNLTSSMYILDEPSIGLHPRDTGRLISVLRTLRNLGNTVIVVEHEEDIIRSADYIIDMGPFAGHLGGEVIYAGEAKTIHKDSKSLTGKYLSGKMLIPIPKHRRKAINKIHIKQANKFNLKNFDVEFPLNALTVVTGVSGSGKTTLVKEILYPGLKAHIDGLDMSANKHGSLEGDYREVDQVQLIDQNPLGRSSRSNPVTYIKAYDAIRELFSNQKLAQVRGYQSKHFSFNVDGGRCEECKGDGTQVVEMQFLADVHLVCEECDGKRFKQEVLEVKYRDKSIADVLSMSVDEAIEFFEEVQHVRDRILPLQKVGLGYVQLGQASSTLSGGEAQRVKLASYLGRGQSDSHILFIFDEPTTGLHFHDIHKLLAAFNALVEKGHTVIIIEHNLDIVKTSDWVIDLGPEGGEEGGELLFQGKPEQLTKVKKSYTGKYLKEKLAAEQN